MNKYLFPKPRSDRLAVSRKKVGYRSKIKQFFLFFTNIIYYFCKKIASSGCTSAIEIHFIAFGLHRPCTKNKRIEYGK